MKLFSVFRILFYIEGHWLTFHQLFKPFSDNSGEMDKNIFSAFVIENKTKSFFFIKPFDSTAIYSGASRIDVIQNYIYFKTHQKTEKLWSLITP